MEDMLNAVEVFKIAEQIERDGAEFYRQAARRFAHGGIHDLFVNLVDWELAHAAAFAAMREQLEKENPLIKVSDPDKYKAMAALSEFAIRSGTLTELTGAMTIQNVLEMALQKEKDSVTFYNGLKGFVTDKTATQKINDIINEEHHHIELLTSKL